ncbi:MAG: SprT-like family protein [Candidatus Solibacter sp.]
MTPASARKTLADAALGFHAPEGAIQQRVRAIHQWVLNRSQYIRQPNYTSIHPQDLELLFAAYDREFFTGMCSQALESCRLRFRLSPRMTKAGGTTARFVTSTGETLYEITVASSMLFDGFGQNDRQVTVCGLACADRLEALQRIFEHETVHLIEQVCWQHSNCSAPRFQDIAHRHFLHRAHTHKLITRRERAAQSGIGVGSRVTFLFEERRLAGRVNRLTKRATVLVEDADGERFSDGRRYRKYYVPIVHLQPHNGA